MEFHPKFDIEQKACLRLSWQLRIKNHFFYQSPIVSLKKGCHRGWFPIFGGSLFSFLCTNFQCVSLLVATHLLKSFSSYTS